MFDYTKNYNGFQNFAPCFRKFCSKKVNIYILTEGKKKKKNYKVFSVYGNRELSKKIMKIKKEIIYTNIY